MSGVIRLEFRWGADLDVLRWHAKRFRVYLEGNGEPVKDFKLRDKITGYIFLNIALLL